MLLGHKTTTSKQTLRVWVVCTAWRYRLQDYNISSAPHSLVAPCKMKQASYGKKKLKIVTVCHKHICKLLNRLVYLITHALSNMYSSFYLVRIQNIGFKPIYLRDEKGILTLSYHMFAI